jgi:hypothetical protein
MQTEYRGKSGELDRTQRWRKTMKYWRIVPACAGGAIIVLLAFVWMQWGSREETVKLTNFSHEKGYAYIAPLDISTRKLSFLGIKIKIKYKTKSGDSVSSPYRSTLQLFENGLALGPAHSLHDDIRNIGQGKFSHWGAGVYFSTSDNSDPQANGRIYMAKAQLVMTGRIKRILNVLLVFALVGMMVSFYRVFAWFFSALMALRFLGLIALLTGCVVMLLKWNRIPIGSHLPGVLLHGGLLVFLVFLFLMIAFFLKRMNVKNSVRWLARALGYALFLFQFVLATEIVCRIFPLPDTLAINPGVRHFWPDWVYYPLNNAGYREKDFKESKSENVFRIFVVGDSDVEGAGLRRDQTAGSFLERELNRRLEKQRVKKRVEVLNLGHCGANTVQEFEWMKKDVPRFHPDLVVMGYVLNDAEEQGISLIDQNTSRLRARLNEWLTGVDGSYLWYRYLDFERVWFPRKSVDTKYNNYYEAIHCDDCRGWIAAQRTFVDMKTYFGNQRVDWFYFIYPIFNSGKPQQSLVDLHGKIYKAMRAKDVDAYDLLSYFLSREENLGKLAFSYRDPHPNAKAQEILSEFLADQILERASFKAFLNSREEKSA